MIFGSVVFAGCSSMSETQHERLWCNECNEPVRIEKHELAGLVLTCDCDKQYSIKTAKALPMEWTA